MNRRMLKSKIHRATVTEANLNYVGSITIDRELMAEADIREWEQVFVVNVNNGARFETYAMEGVKGEICLNGAAARLAHPGDLVIIFTYTDVDLGANDDWQPRILLVDEKNRVLDSH